MRLMFRAALVTAWLLAGAVAAGADPPKPPANDDCLACHDDPGAKRSNGTSITLDRKSFAASKHADVACVDCHADLAALKDFPHPDRLAKVDCGSCHDGPAAKYHDSIHWRARNKAGLIVAPSCVDCHGNHDVREKTDASSRIFRANIPSTCGKCHAGIQQQYEAGIHAAALRKGDGHAPVCADCHTAHAIQRADTDAWRLSVTAECGTCHAGVVESFRRTFHGKVTELGFARVAACADCHGAHDILPASNPASMVSPARTVETCGKCHTGVNASFVQYDPHPNPRNYERSRVLWWANRFYWILIPGCFGFFGLHSVLWFRRSWRHGIDRHQPEGDRR